MKQRTYKNILKDNKNKVYSYAFYFLHNHQDAEDVTQEVFIKLWNNRERVDSKRIVSWLMRVTHNYCIDLIRQKKDSRSQQKVMRSIDWEIMDKMEGSDKNPEYSYEKRETKAVLLSAIRTLPDNVKSMMLLHYFQGLKYNEISEMLDVNENTVKVTVHRGRKILREVLTERFPERARQYNE